MEQVSNQTEKLSLKAIGESVHAWRKALMYSLVQVAEGTGLNYHTILALEKGKTQPKLETVIKIADMFELTIDELIGRKLFDDAAMVVEIKI